jgi:nitroimidazol reductase NimA-like FMN-containing flavoprotein (pyridoxamine 5'-phosphate oxidase superfamily)
MGHLPSQGIAVSNGVRFDKMKSSDLPRTPRRLACLQVSTCQYNRDFAVSDIYEPTQRSTVKRLPKRGVYDRDVVHKILDEALMCHVGFAVDGQPFVIPTIHVRVGETIYVHGSPASRMLRTLEEGVPACVTVTLVDGLVLARSAFHHSMNYRSVVAFGTARLVAESAEKARVLHALTDHLVRGRWEEIRRPSEDELRKTLVLAIPIEEASAKIRTGPPLDEEEDYALPFWAGVVPLAINSAAPIADPRLADDAPVPDYAAHYGGPGPA